MKKKSIAAAVALMHDKALAQVEESAQQAQQANQTEEVAALLVEVAQQRNMLSAAVGIYAVLTVARNPDTAKPAGKQLRAHLKEAMGTFEGDVKCPAVIDELVQGILSIDERNCVSRKRARKRPATASVADAEVAEAPAAKKAQAG
eukprot:11191339-Lingulodinium_polyedra.AAC.1